MREQGRFRGPVFRSLPRIVSLAHEAQDMQAIHDGLPKIIQYINVFSGFHSHYTMVDYFRDI